MEKRYVIYRHLKPNGEVFYIGIGSEKRAYQKNPRSDFWKRVVSIHGYEVQILKSDLTWEDACELEILLISWYGRRNLNTGTLVNMTEGGDGSVGYSPSEESRRSRSEKMKGVPKSEKARKNMNKSKIGKSISEEHRLKCKLSNAKKVINIETGEIYTSVQDLIKISNFTSAQLYDRLGGRLKNKTNYMYLTDYISKEKAKHILLYETLLPF